MSELVIRNQRSLPDEAFSADGAVGFIVEEMVGALVSDCDRVKGQPLWISLCVGVSQDETFPGTKTIWASMRCDVNLTEVVSRV